MENNEISKIEGFLFETHKVLKLFENLNQPSTSINYLIDNCYRSYDILVSIDCLCKKVINLNEIEHPLGILLRSGLYDFIHFQYYSNKCISKGKFDSKKFAADIDEYLKGHINKIEWDSDLKERYKDIVEYKDDGKLKEFKTMGILKEGKSVAKEKKLNYLQSAIEYWEWYSKYEHYGCFTNKMLMDFKGNYSRINLSIKVLFANIYLSLLTIYDIDSNLLILEKIKQIENILLND